MRANAVSEYALMHTYFVHVHVSQPFRTNVEIWLILYVSANRQNRVRTCATHCRRHLIVVFVYVCARMYFSAVAACVLHRLVARLKAREAPWISRKSKCSQKGLSVNKSSAAYHTRLTEPTVHPMRERISCAFIAAEGCMLATTPIPAVFDI